MGPKKKVQRDLVLDSSMFEDKKKTQQGFNKRGPLGPQSKSRGTLLWRACDIYIFTDDCQVQVLCTYMYIRNKAQEIMYINKYVQHGLGWTVTSPNIFLGSITLYNIYRHNSGTGCPTKQFLAMVHPAPPHRLAHTLWGSRLNCPWPTGT